MYGSGASKVEAEYDAPGTVTDATAAQTEIDMATDYAFRCPARAFARAMLASGAQHYYLYEYNIGPSWHSFELVPLFNLTALTALGATNPSMGYADEMRGYWTKFAATGAPNGAGDSGAPMWPGYDATSDQYLELLDPTPMTVTNLRKAQCDFWDSYTP